MNILIRIYNFFLRLYVRISGLSYGSGLTVKGKPVIYVRSGATVVLGNRVTLHSRAKYYHAHMHSPTKILCDQRGGEIIIGDDTRINGACIHAKKSIRIGKRCLIASGVQVLDSNGHKVSMEDPSQRYKSVDVGSDVVIEDDVWIGINAIVLPGSRIGRGTVIGAGCVVSGNIPEGSIVTVQPCLVSGCK